MNNYFDNDSSFSPAEKLRILKDNADKIETGKYIVPLTPEQLDQKREQMVAAAITLSDLDDQLDEIKKGFKQRMDPLKVVHKELLYQVKNRQEQKEGELYLMADHEKSMMNVYDENGDLVFSRRLTPDEKQGTILQAIRPAANQ